MRTMDRPIIRKFITTCDWLSSGPAKETMTCVGFLISVKLSRSLPWICNWSKFLLKEKTKSLSLIVTRWVKTHVYLQPLRWFLKGPLSTNRQFVPWNNFHIWKSRQSWNSPNQIATISNANFQKQKQRLKSLSVEDGPLIFSSFILLFD